ncbi:MAG: MmgE/PrpD family protein [Betaproteobacteria bacterium]|nr:MmgE/PrpD family protein [Betaproteobacteria bacterium]
MRVERIPSGSAAQLIEFASGLASTSVPAPVMEQAKWCLLDGVACGLFGSTQSWAKIMAEEIAAERPYGQCTMLGHAQTVAAPAAALANGTALHGFELDDLIPAAIVHPGCVVVPRAAPSRYRRGHRGGTARRAWHRCRSLHRR